MVRKRDLKEVLEERRGETQIACYKAPVGVNIWEYIAWDYLRQEWD